MADKFDKDAFIDAAVRGYVERLEYSLQHQYRDCDLYNVTSPIEFMLGVALDLALLDIRDPAGSVDDTGMSIRGCEFSKLVLPPWNGVWFYPQCRIGKYTADFVIHYRIDDIDGAFVVECDGHDYHERTKEQAIHDKKRDRTMQALGLPVFRYTGSEIFKDAGAVADDIIDHLFSLINLRRHRGTN